MSAHATLEQLSRFLDEELEVREQLSVKGHVAECASCRERLKGLRRVVGELDRLRAQSPPRHLGRLVGRRLELVRPPGGLLRRLEERRRRSDGLPALAPLFGVVLALAIVLYLFTLGVARWERRAAQRVVVPPATAVGESGSPALTEWRPAGGREFRRVGELWLERGVDAAAPAEVVDPEDLEPKLLEELAGIEQLDGQVRLRLSGRLIEIDVGRLPPVSGE